MPRFVSLKSDKINLRRGPGLQYPIDWIYQRKHLPVEIVGEFENWRKIKDWEGIVGWVYHGLLSGRRTIRIMNKTAALRERPAEDSKSIAWLELGVVGLVESCTFTWCLTNIEGRRGYLATENLYGIYENEIIE